MPTKHFPVQRMINVDQPSPAANTLAIRYPKLVSEVNHRLYRESRNYELSVTLDASSGEATTVDVYALADTWYLRGALKLAKMAWDESNKEEIAMNAGKVSRWNDFRIAPGITGAADARPVQFNQSTLTPGPMTDGDYEFAQVVDQAGVTRTFTLGTPGATEYNIIAQYDAQSGTSTDPEIVSTSPYDGLLPNLETDAAAAISDVGNRPPYRRDGYGTAIWVKVATLQITPNRQKLSTGFFQAPLGMVVLTGVGSLAARDIQVTAKAGDYKGLKSSSMME